MLPRFDTHLRVSAGFCFLAAWFAAVNGWGLLLIILGAAAAHEAGHWVALRLLEVEIQGLRIGVLGAVLEADCRDLSYGKELAVVLAGPGTNLLCAWLLSGLGRSAEVAVGAHLVLGMFNLLPVRPLDGGRALCLLVTWLLGPEAGEQAARWVGTAAAAALAAGIFCFLHRTGGSLWLLPAAGGLLVTAWREWFGKERFRPDFLIFL